MIWVILFVYEKSANLVDLNPLNKIQFPLTHFSVIYYQLTQTPINLNLFFVSLGSSNEQRSTVVSDE